MFTLCIVGLNKSYFCATSKKLSNKLKMRWYANFSSFYFSDKCINYACYFSVTFFKCLYFIKAVFDFQLWLCLIVHYFFFHFKNDHSSCTWSNDSILIYCISHTKDTSDTNHPYTQFVILLQSNVAKTIWKSMHRKCISTGCPTRRQPRKMLVWERRI